MDSLLESALRQSIMDWVAQRAERRGGWLSREELLNGFVVGGSPLPLIDRSRGIRNPSILASTLSIVSSVDGRTSTTTPETACCTTPTAQAAAAATTPSCEGRSSWARR